MAKNRKSSSSKKTSPGSQKAEDSKAAANGAQKKEEKSQTTAVKTSSAPTQPANKAHISDRQQKKSRSAAVQSQSGIAFKIIFILLTVVIAFTGVIFRDEIRGVTEYSYQTYVLPKLLALQSTTQPESSGKSEREASQKRVEEDLELTATWDSVEDLTDSSVEELTVSSTEEPVVSNFEKNKPLTPVVVESSIKSDESIDNNQSPDRTRTQETEDIISSNVKQEQEAETLSVQIEAPDIGRSISEQQSETVVIHSNGDSGTGDVTLEETIIREDTNSVESQTHIVQTDMESVTQTDVPKTKEDTEEKQVHEDASMPVTEQALSTDEEAKDKQEAQNEQHSQPERKTESYLKSSITSKADFKIHKELDEADDLLAQEKLEQAIEKYDSILQQHTSSPRAHYGKGLTLDRLGFKYMSNDNLEQSIEMLGRVLLLPDVPDELVKMAGRKLADRQQFRGWGGQAAKTLKSLIQRFPDDLSLRNELGVSYLMIGQNDRARDVFKEVLARDASNGFAKAHLGFILKTQDNDLEKAVELLNEGIKSGEPGTSDGRFYLHLGDSLLRLGREQEARKIFQEGEEKGLFLSAWQRSLYNVDRLTGRPWWTPEQTTYQDYLKLLQDNWKTIRDEGLAQLNARTGSFLPEEENLRDTGDWKQFTLYQQGRKKTENCAKVPETCKLIDRIPDAKGCKRGQVKFSVMSPGIHVWPHVGPTNCRIRAHLGLVVPEGPIIRVMNETRTWKEGQFIIFDDSFEHEVWHEGSELRLVLIVDFWHPELTEAEKRKLSAI